VLGVFFFGLYLVAISCGWLMRCTGRRPHFYRHASGSATLDAERVEPAPAHARRKPAWATQEVLRLKVLMGRAGCRQIATTFNRLHQAHPRRTCTVGKTFVADCIKANQYALAQLRRDMRCQLPRPVPINLNPAVTPSP
jgi:hypothetical protein